MVDDPLPEFIIDALPEDRVQNLKTRLKSRVQQNKSGPIGGTAQNSNQKSGRILLCGSANDEIFLRATSDNFSGLYEVFETTDPDQCADHLFSLLNCRTWFFSASSKHMFNSSFDEHLSKMIGDNRRLGQENRDLMRTAIDEAITNAVVHGNLELHSPPMHSINDFTAFYANIAERLAQPIYGDRQITIQKWAEGDNDWVSVADQGHGYAPHRERRLETPKSIRPGQKERRRSGRGLEIIRSLTKQTRLDQQGRRLSMQF